MTSKITYLTKWFFKNRNSQEIMPLL